MTSRERRQGRQRHQGDQPYFPAQKPRALNARRLMAELYDLKDAYADWASSRCQRCSHFLAGNAVKVCKLPGALPHYQGLQRCGLAWECPICSARIKTQRADEVRRAVEWHAARYGADNVFLATFTLRHQRRDDLQAVRRGIAKAFQRFQAGKAWTDFKGRNGFVGSIRALEVTHGWSNGWHPHLHVILLLRNCPAADELRAWLFERWAKCVARILGDAHVPLEFDPAGGDALGVDVRHCKKADYIAKLGLELSSPSTKRGRGAHRTPLEILDDFRDAGTAADLELYREFVRAMKGARQLTWSKGLKAAATVEERTDEELVEGDEGGENIAMISAGEWSAVRKVTRAKSAVLEMAEQFGAQGVFAMVDAFMGRPPAPNLSHRLLEAPQMLLTLRPLSKTARVV